MTNRRNDSVSVKVGESNRKSNQLFSEEQLTFATIQEHALTLSEKINEHCNLFRNRLINRQVLGCEYVIAKFYYDIAYVNYEYYSNDKIKNNLLSVKQYLEKCINQFDCKKSITDKISIVNDAKYFLDLDCDFYVRSNLDENVLPQITGNAVVVVKTSQPDKYFSYFVENHTWLKVDNRLKCIELRDLNLNNIEFVNENGLVRKNEQNKKTIDTITTRAHLLCGRVSVNMQYYKLKRRRKTLEKDLAEEIMKANQTTTTAIQNEERISKILSEIIECNLEIGLVDEAQYYIDLLKNMNRESSDSKLKEYQLRKDLIIQLRIIIESEVSLLFQLEDDVKYFVIKKLQTLTDYNAEIEKWKDIYKESNSRSILFILNQQMNENQWESYFWIPDKRKEVLSLKINENSSLHQFLQHVNDTSVINSFNSKLLDMLTDENIFSNINQNSDIKTMLFINEKFNLKSKRTKIIYFSQLLETAYAFVICYPLAQRYHRAVLYFSKEKINIDSSQTQQEDLFPLSLFPSYLGASIKKLNDTISENEFFIEILPYIDQMKNVQRSLNCFYDIDWLFCENENERENILKIWHEGYKTFKEQNPYQKKYLFLLVECDFYFFLDFDRNHPLQINRNAIVLSKTAQSSDYNAYFVKDNCWMKYHQTNIVEDICLENISVNEETRLINKNTFRNEKDKSQIETIATNKNLNRWYFYGETPFGRISEGFIDRKEELKVLTSYLKNITHKGNIIERNETLIRKETQILNSLSRIFEIDKEISSQEHFIKSISKTDYEKQCLLSKGIRIYDIRKFDNGIRLKHEIKSDINRSFSCIVRLPSKHYITLFIENKTQYNDNYNLRYIYILDSAIQKTDLRVLNWFSGVMNQCIYELHSIHCPKQRQMSEDSLMHAYFNAAACQWAFDNHHWDFLKRNFHRQKFSNEENIEKIKKWFIEVDEKIPVLDYTKVDFSVNKTIEIIEKFKSQLKNIFQQYLIPIKQPKDILQRVETLSKQFVNIKSFDQISEFIHKIQTKDNENEFQNCIQAIQNERKNLHEEQRETLEIHSIVDIMFEILNQVSLDLLDFQKELSENFESFEDKLNHTILLNLFEKHSSVVQNQYPECAKKIKSLYEESRITSDQFVHLCFEKFLELLKNFIEKENDFSNADEFISQCEHLQQILFNSKIKDATTTNTTAEKSFKEISSFIDRFVEIEDSLKKFHEIFQCLLPLCYELHLISDINKELKEDVYDKICHQKQSFDDIRGCIIDRLGEKMRSHESINVKLNLKDVPRDLDNIFRSFNLCLCNKDKNDERAIHYVGAYLRQSMMNRIDGYMTSLVSFRHQSLNSIETFEKFLHECLLNSVRDIIKHGAISNSLATQTLLLLSSDTFDYKRKMSEYKNVIRFLAGKDTTIPSEIIDNLNNQLDNTSHSHFVYLQPKIEDLTKMLQRFAAVEKYLPEFSRIFRQRLNDRYDHLPEQEVFSIDGQVTKEIFKRLKPSQNFNDIKEIIKFFEHQPLFDIIKACENFVKDKDEKASTEISQCLRQCIIDTVEEYSSSLLDFRHRARVAFNQFEKDFYELFLSTYDSIKDTKLKSWLREKLKKLLSHPNYSNETYSDYWNLYKEIIEYLVKKHCEFALTVKEIFTENEHSLKPLFKEKVNNLKILLNGYENWYAIEIEKRHEYAVIQIKTTSGILSEIINVVVSKYPDCCCPNNEIRIINSDKLYIDEDLSDTNYSGVNIVIVSPHQKLVKNKGKLEIKTNGKDAKDSWKHKPAKSGHGTGENGKGNKGENGSDGKAGKSAGHVYVVANKLPSIEVSAIGGQGGQGQNGGNGAPGLDGRDGIDADRASFEKEVKEAWFWVGSAWSIRYRRIGTDGTSGGTGGDAGSGGYHGKSGDPGLVKLHALNEISSNVRDNSSNRNPENKDGKPGTPGEAGKHGRDGVDCILISNYIGPHRAAWTKRTIDDAKEGRISSHYRRDHKEGKIYSDYSMLPFDNDEDHSRFQDKYTDKNAHQGANRSNKHKDQETVKKIHAINYQHVFQQTEKFFNQYCNPKNSASYQHWLAESLNEFLEKMAAAEGLPPYNVHTLPDIEHDAKQLLILKENFSQIIDRENQRLETEKLNSDEMNIGVMLLTQEILNQYNEYLKQYQVVYQQLQDEIQRVDISQLGTGLEIRSTEIANLKRSVNRIINEHRFSRQLAAAQRRMEVLVDKPNEDLSKLILDRQNVKIIKEILDKQEWRVFEIGDYIVNKILIQEFNQTPNEKSLLAIGNDFLVQLREILSSSQTCTIDLNQTSNFIHTYLYNSQQANYLKDNLEELTEQRQKLYKLFIEFSSLENTSTLDLLIAFYKGLNREYLRHYWLICTKKTLECKQGFPLENRKEMETNLFQTLHTIRIADDYQLEQINVQLTYSFISREFVLYDFDQNLYCDNKPELINSMNDFNQNCNQQNLIKIFQNFSNSSFFDQEKTLTLQTLLANGEQLNIIKDFLFAFYKNLRLLNLDKSHFEILTEHIQKIEVVLLRNLRSYFYDLLFSFFIIVERIKIEQSISPNRNNELDEIEKSYDMHQLLNFHSSKPNEKVEITYTIEQQIDAFNTLYDPTLAEQILERCSNRLPENKKSVEFINWITNNRHQFEDKSMRNIFRIVGDILRKVTREEIPYALEFLRIVFDYTITKVDITKEEELINRTLKEKQNLLITISSGLQRIDELFQDMSRNRYRSDKVIDFCDGLIEFNDLKKPTDFQGLSDEILREIKVRHSQILRNISTETQKIDNSLNDLKNVDQEISNQDKKKIEDTIENYKRHLKTTIDYLKKTETILIQQSDKNGIFREKKTLLTILDILFSNVEYIHDDIRFLVAKKLNRIYENPNSTLFNITVSHEELTKQSKFCLFTYDIKQIFVDKINIHFRKNTDLNRLLEDELEQLFIHYVQHENADTVLSNLALEIIDIFNLCQLVPNEQMDESLEKIIKKLNTIRNQNLKEQILFDLPSSYSIFNKELVFIKRDLDKFYSNNNDKKLKDYEFILTFLYQELNQKSKFVQEIYEMFYAYCKTLVSSSASNQMHSHFQNIIYLMKFITIVHRDSTNTNGANIDHAQFQVILLHVLFQKEKPLGVINDGLIHFLDWLFQILCKYDSTEKIDIEFEHIIQMKILCSNVNKYCEDSSRQNVYMYQYFKQAIDTVSHEMKIIYIEKYIKVLFEKHSNAKWLEIIIYFPEFFEINNEVLLNLIKKKQDLLDVKEINQIQKFIFDRIAILQEEKFERFYKLILTKDEKIENAFEDFHGFVNREKDSFDKKHPYEVLAFNNLIDALRERLEIDGGLLINIDIFVKVQHCLSCFEDIRLPIEILPSSSQKDWLKALLIEHIIEKFYSIFPKNNQIENLRNLLMRIKENLLLLFNNKFVKEYIDQISQQIYLNKNFLLPNYQKLTREKFLHIVDLMTKISVTKEYLNQLSDASLSVWDTILHEIEFSQFFTVEINKVGINVSEGGAEKALLFLNRIRTELGIENHDIFLTFFENICEKIGKTRTKEIKQLNKLLGAIYHKVISFEQGCTIVLKHAYENWLNEKSEELKFPADSIDNQSDRLAEDIINLMIDQQKNKTNTISKETLTKIAEQAKRFKDIAKTKTVSEGDQISVINRQIQDILNLQSYQENSSEYVRSHFDDIIPLILYAWSVANKPQFPKDTQIIALLLFISSEGKGLLEQIRTGEGKTLIVGLTAAFFALCGNAVHVVSSNRDLAIEGEQKCRSFFQLLKVESGHICHESDDANHQSYRLSLDTPQGNIVYGEVGGFQRDILESEFNNKKLFDERYEKRKKCLIVDEVDNMCLDRARHVLYLSHEIQSLKWLETLFINIWIAVLRVDINNTNDMSEHIKDISEFIIHAVKNKMIYVPDYLHEYVDYKIKRWIDSAFQARIMREDDHFVLDIAKTDDQTVQKHRTIIVLDKDTGTEQYSTRWSNGLAQFLELKYRRKLSVESLKAVFISNKTFFQRYKDCLYGLTGTLGSQNSQSFLSDLYNVQFANLPTSKQKYFYQVSSKVAFEYNDWLDLIAKETIEQAKERPVLIICENVEATDNIWGELIRYGVAPHTITKYRRDGDNIEERFRKKPATMGDIIIATNKGGRGTDIHVNPNMNAKGGMHVILGYLPENVRIEEQAFGRTARNGAAGTGQFILQVDRSTYEKIYDLSQYPRDIQQMKLADLSDVIIEREKINRDNKEAARLSELKKKSILRLEVEQELFDKFNEFKRNITDKVFQTLFQSKPDEYKEKFVAVFQNVLKDRWAFWLDKAKDDIDAIKTSGQKSSLLNKYDSSFIGELTHTLENSSFNHLLENFIKKPEEAMQVGQVCLSVEEFSMAKMCFEKAVTYGDSSGFSYMGIAFCIIKLHDGGNVKKESRRELKKAICCLESVKRNLMANLKIAEILPQSASAEIFQKISSKENLYEDQIRGKIEIIGLHLHYLNNAVGQTVEPYDFILHAKEGEELTKEKKEEGERLYKSLVDGGLIQGNRRRKAFENATERVKMEQEIRDNVDPSIAESIILLLDENKCQQKDLENIVCYNDQLWEVLNIRHTEDVFILDKSRIERVLPQEYEKLWKDLEGRIDPSHVDISLFETNYEMKQFRVYLEEKKMLSKTKRAKIEQLNPESLRFDGEYEKYSRINFNDHGHKPSNLKTFLEKLKEQITSQGGEYIYQTDLPFSTQEDEAKKILMFLKDKNIVKSGGLAIHKHGDTSEDIDRLLDEILPVEFKNDKDLIKPKILALQGDIRSCQEDLKATLKDFIDLKDQEKVPNGLKFFEGLGLNKFLIIEEDKSWWDWNAFAVAMIGLAQVIGGAVLIAFGCVNIGGALIAEGINDMIYATMAGLSGTFSWKDWAIQKAISFSISLLTCGIGKLATIGTTVATVGSVSITAIVTQVVKQAVYQFATTCLSKIADEKINETMKALLVPKLVKLVEDNLLQGVYDKTNEKVKRLYTTSKDKEEFEQGFAELKQNIEVALGKNVFNQQFDNIRIQVASAFKKSYDTILKGLSNSSSKYLKIAASAIKIGLLVDKIVNGVQYALKLANTFQAFIKIFDNQIAGKHEGEEKQEEDTTIIKHRSDQLISIIKAYVTKVLTQGLITILTKIMNGEFIRMAKNMVNFVKTLVNEEFNQKNPIDTLKTSKRNVTEDGQSQVLVEQPCEIENSSQERQDEMERDDIQNNIQNPKKLMENMSNETNDENRALGRPDIQMLADKKCRDIIIYNKDTGETETIRPSGLRKIPAFFKQEAEINYEAGENGDIGHFTNARDSEVYKQLNGRNDCLFTAYNESLDQTVDENSIQRERENFDRYIAENQTRYSQYRENENVNGRTEIIGGGQRTKRNYFEGVENLHERSAKRDPSKQHSGESDHAQDRSSSSGVGTTKIDVTNFSVDETKETVGTYTIIHI